jgi:predicted MFS family arabinose efflux permease
VVIGGLDGPLRRVLVVVCLVQIADFSLVQVITPLLPYYADRFGFEQSESGHLVAAFAIGSLVFAIPAAMVCSRVGVKATVVGGVLFMAAASVAFGFADSLFALEAARFGQGMASAAAWVGALAWIVGAAPRERRAGLLGIVFGLGIAGLLAGPALGVLAAHLGPKPTFVGIALALVGLAGLAALLPPVPAVRQPVRALVGGLRNRVVAFGVWLYLLPAFLLAAQHAVAPLRLDELGWTVGGIGAIYVCAAAIQSVGSPVLGRLLDRVGRTAPLRAILIAGVTVSTLLALPWSRQHWLFAILVVCAVVSFAAFYLPGSALIADGADAAGLDQAFGFSLANLAWAPGTIVGSIVGGAVAESAGDEATYVMLAAVCLGTLLVVRRVIAGPIGAHGRARAPAGFGETSSGLHSQE